MTLETIATEAMIGSINTLLVANGGGMIDFYVNAGDIPTGSLTGTGLLNTGTRLQLATQTAITPIAGTLGTFVTPAADTVAADGSNIVGFFAMFNTVATSVSTTHMILTGTVALTTADITFSTTRWDQGDNVSITSLTWQQPAS